MPPPPSVLFCKQGCWNIQRVGAASQGGAAAGPLGSPTLLTPPRMGSYRLLSQSTGGRQILLGEDSPGGHKGLYK